MRAGTEVPGAVSRGTAGPFLPPRPDTQRLRPPPRWRWRERGGAGAGSGSGSGDGAGPGWAAEVRAGDGALVGGRQRGARGAPARAGGHEGGCGVRRWAMRGGTGVAVGVSLWGGSGDRSLPGSPLPAGWPWHRHGGSSPLRPRVRRAGCGAGGLWEVLAGGDVGRLASGKGVVSAGEGTWGAGSPLWGLAEGLGLGHRDGGMAGPAAVGAGGEETAASALGNFGSPPAGLGAWGLWGTSLPT